MRQRSTLAVLLASAAIALAPVASLAESSSYTYDALGRVITQTDADGTTITFSYDPAGNRTQRVTTAGTKTRPNAVNDTLSVSGSTPGSTDPRTNDTDPNGHALSVSGVANGAHGTTSFTSSSVTYTAATGYAGSDTFSYTVTDTDNLSSKAYVNVTVTAPPIAPVANNVSKTVAYNSSSSPITLNITGGTPTSVATPTLPSHGTRTISGPSISYAPTTGYSGPDSFTYTASNSTGTSAPATISITVNPAAPVANNVTATVNQNSSANPITLNITGGTPTSVAVSTAASHGTATASGTTISYTPTSGYTGSDTFAYTASNAGGTSSPATANITVNASSPTHISPNPAWANITFTTSQTHGAGSNGAQTIQGITSTVSLSLTTTGVSGSGSLQYSKNGGAWTNWTSGTTVTAVNGDTFAFQATDPNAESEYSGTIHVTNLSDSNTQIGQFTFDITVNGCIDAC